MYDTLASSLSLLCSHSPFTPSVGTLHGFLHRKLTEDGQRKALHGSESEIPRPCRQRRDPEEPSQRVTTPPLTHLWKGQTGSCQERRQSKNGRKKLYSASEKGKRLKEKEQTRCVGTPNFLLLIP